MTGYGFGRERRQLNRLIDDKEDLLCNDETPATYSDVETGITSSLEVSYGKLHVKQTSSIHPVVCDVVLHHSSTYSLII